MKILVVDDDRAVARAVARMLVSREVEIASSGGEALERLARGPGVDVILCDVMMHGLTGLELFEELARRDVT